MWKLESTCKGFHISSLPFHFIPHPLLPSSLPHTYRQHRPDDVCTAMVGAGMHRGTSGMVQTTNEMGPLCDRHNGHH